jgi:hypothetical protein
LCHISNEDNWSLFSEFLNPIQFDQVRFGDLSTVYCFVFLPRILIWESMLSVRIVGSLGWFSISEALHLWSMVGKSMGLEG